MRTRSRLEGEISKIPAAMFTRPRAVKVTLSFVCIICFLFLVQLCHFVLHKKWVRLHKHGGRSCRRNELWTTSCKLRIVQCVIQMGSLVVLLFCDTIPSICVKLLWLECGGYFYNFPPKYGMASRNKARLLRMTLKGGGTDLLQS